MSCPTIYRVLVRTHHMTSRKKIVALTKAAKHLSCAVLLKTGKPPGIMLAEGARALEWLEVVRKLRYKDYRLVKKEPVATMLPTIVPGSVMEFTSPREFGAFLAEDPEVHDWWRVNMGYGKVELSF